MRISNSKIIYFTFVSEGWEIRFKQNMRKIFLVFIFIPFHSFAVIKDTSKVKHGPIIIGNIGFGLPGSIGAGNGIFRFTNEGLSININTTFPSDSFNVDFGVRTEYLSNPIDMDALVNWQGGTVKSANGGNYQVLAVLPGMYFNSHNEKPFAFHFNVGFFYFNVPAVSWIGDYTTNGNIMSPHLGNFVENGGHEYSPCFDFGIAIKIPFSSKHLSLLLNSDLLYSISLGSTYAYQGVATTAKLTSGNYSFSGVYYGGIELFTLSGGVIYKF